MRKFITDILAKTNLGVEQNAYVLGTVGIGTSTPIGNLDIYQAANPSLYIRDNSSIIRILPFGGITYFQTATSLSGGSTTDLYFSGMFGTPVNMVIKAGGNVGIGTTSPSAKLHVTGELKLTDAAAAYTFFDQINGTYYSVWYRNNNITYLYDSYLNSNPFVINSSGNVGIGTTSPGAKLHLYGSGATELRIGSSTGNTNSLLSFYEVGIASWCIDAGQANGSFFIKDLYNTRTVVALSNSGNVGIGTTSPSYKLQVNADGAGLYVIGANTAPYTQTIASFVYGGNSNSINIENQAGKASIQARAGGSTMDLLLNPVSGNVGIGTGSPAAKLDVNGSIYAVGDIAIRQSGSSSLSLYRANSGYQSATLYWEGSGLYWAAGMGYGTYSWVINDTNYGVNNKFVVTQGTTWGVGIGTASPTAKLDVAGSGVSTDFRVSRSADPTAYLSINAPGGGPNASIIGINGVDVMTLRVDGNVGIGTSSPGFKLDVTGTTSDWATRFTSNANASAYFANGAGYGAYIDAGSNATSSTYLMSLVSNGSTRVYVRGDGMVGIGTGYPSLESAGLGLDILNSSYTQLRVRSSASSAGIEMTPATGIRWELQASTSNEFFIYDRTNNQFRLLINGSGNVGIGTSSPSYKLDVATGNDNAIRILNSLGSNNNGFALAVGSGTPWLDFYGGRFDIKYNTSPGSWNSGSNIFLSILSSGNVGIGTTNPADKLEVAGNIRATEGGIASYRTSSEAQVVVNLSGNQMYMFNNSTSYGIYSTDYGSLFIRTKSTGLLNIYDKIYATSGGNVGIGTTTPPSHLSVVGNIESIITVSTATVNYLKLGTYYAGQWGSYVGSGSNYSSTLDTDLRFGVSSGGTATEVVRITAGGNVGIGTTSPSYKLHVDGGASGIPLFVKGGTSGWSIFERNNKQLYINANYSDLNLYAQVSPAAVSNMGLSLSAREIVQDLYLTTSGNVGIGTTSPAYKIDVAGNSRFVSGNESLTMFQVNGWATNYLNSSLSAGAVAHLFGKANSLNNSATLRYYHASDASTSNYMGLGFYGNDDILRVYVSGNVGIGTNNPSYKLDVVGSISTNGSINLFNNDLYPFFRIGPMTCQYPYNRVDSVRSDGSGYFWGFGMQEGSTNFVKAFFRDGSRGWHSADQLSVITFDTNEFNGLYPSYTTGARILANGASYFNGGNVGIGTAAPSYKLDVNGETRLGKLITTWSNSPITPSAVIYSESGYNTVFAGNGQFSSSYLALMTTGNMSYMGGNVGIGTTSPTSPGGFTKIVHINGGYASLVLTSTIPNKTWEIGVNSTSLLTFYDGVADRMVIDTNGYVGIGTTNPIGPLTVSARSNGDTIFLLGRSSDNATRIDFYNNARSARLYTIASGNGAIEHYADANVPMTFATNGSERLRITAAGNVGIGTTSPADKLEVAGNIRATTAGAYNSISVYNTGATGGGGFLAYQNGVANGYFGVAGWYQGNSDTGVIIGTDSSSRPIRFFTNTERMRITGDGNVGIGTASPSDELTVNSAGNSTGIAIQRSGVTKGLLEIGSSSDTFAISATSSTGILSFATNSAEAMRIASNGNVGIGTTSPENLLTVGGNVRIVTGTTQGLFAFDASTGGAFIWSITRYTDTNPNDININARNGFAIRTGVTSLTNSGHQFYVTAGGNVGIGTTSPAYKLDVAGVGRLLSVGIIQASSNSDTPNIAFTNNGTSFTWGTIGGLLQGDGDGALFFNTKIGGSVTEKMRITSAGNVGIGTSSPGYKLEVVGTARIRGNVDITTSGGTNVLLAYSSYVQAWQSFYVSQAGGAHNFAVSNASSGGNAYFNNVNVGIGTTSPSTVFHVDTSVIAPAVRLSDFYYDYFIGYGSVGTTKNNNYWQIYRNSSQTYYDQSSGGHYFMSNAVDLLRILQNGNVLIGTTTDSGYKLDVNGTARVLGTHRVWKDNQIGDIDLNLYNGQSGWQGGMYYHTESGGANQRLTLYSGGVIGTADALTITSSRNVGIGTNTPGRKLDINTDGGFGNANNYLRLSASAAGAYSFNSYIEGYYNDYGNGEVGRIGLIHFEGVRPGSNNIGGNIKFYTKNLGGLNAADPTVKMTITADGNVGIGTVSPAARLDISGSGSVLQITDSSTSRNFTFTPSYATGTYGGFFNHSTGNITLGASLGTDNGSTVGIILGAPSGTRTALLQVKGTGSTSATTALLVQNSIGTSKLKIDDGLNSDFIMYSNQKTNGDGIIIQSTNGSTQTPALTLKSLSSAGQGRIWADSDRFYLGMTNINGVNSNNVYLFTIDNRISKFAVTPDGSVTDASFYGKAIWDGGAAMTLRASSAGQSARIFNVENFDGSTNYFNVGATGNVGIGTTSPSAKLDIAGGTEGRYLEVNAIAGFAGLGSGSSAMVEFLNAGDGNTLFIKTQNSVRTDAAPLAVWTENNPRFLVRNDGNVGIGTTSPNERLEVTGSIRLSDGNADGPQLKLASSGYSDWNIDNYSGSLRAYYGGTEYTRLTSSGNFGIGTSSPSYKLHVEGNVSGISIYASHDIAAFSDITVKKDVKKIENAVDKVKELNGYTYVRTDDETGTRRAGVIAQEVQKVLPEVVSQNPDGTLNVAYANMIALLIEGMKEQQATIERMQQEINELKK